jgi:hypothetical protein
MINNHNQLNKIDNHLCLKYPSSYMASARWIFCIKVFQGASFPLLDLCGKILLLSSRRIVQVYSWFLITSLSFAAGTFIRIKFVPFLLIDKTDSWAVMISFSPPFPLRIHETFCSSSRLRKFSQAIQLFYHSIWICWSNYFGWKQICWKVWSHQATHFFYQQLELYDVSLAIEALSFGQSSVNHAFWQMDHNLQEPFISQLFA